MRFSNKTQVYLNTVSDNFRSPSRVISQTALTFIWRFSDNQESWLFLTVYSSSPLLKLGLRHLHFNVISVLFITI